jgi:uncharacterized membrane protein YhaH (DUF805 family)
VAFFFSVPIGRLLFFVRYILTFGLIVMIKSLLEVTLYHAGPMDGTELVFIVGALVLPILPLLYYLMRFVILARLRSIGLSGWFGLLILVPLVNLLFLLFLLFCPTDAFAGKRA